MAAFSPVMSNKLYIQIHNQIREAILNGTYKPRFSMSAVSR